MLTSENLDRYLTAEDTSFLDELMDLYNNSLQVMHELRQNKHSDKLRQNLIRLYGLVGQRMQDFVAQQPRVNVYSFKTPRPLHGEASYLIAKLRDKQTGRQEFIYYIQRAYELLFNLVYNDAEGSSKNHLIVETPVDSPFQNYAVHKIPNIDNKITSTSMCVMLRGALLPSMIMSKAIEEYSSINHVTPFALFKIQRKEHEKDKRIQYLLDVQRSYFRPEDLHGKDLIFADPMNATGGSFTTVVSYLHQQNIVPRSIKLLTVIAAAKGVLRVLRTFDNVHIYTIWMDPMLNESSFIMPGLGDAGDRINGQDFPESRRDIIQLIADYGATICNLYRSQVRTIEKVVLH